MLINNETTAIQFLTPDNTQLTHHYTFNRTNNHETIFLYIMSNPNTCVISTPTSRDTSSRLIGINVAHIDKHMVPVSIM